MWRISSQRLFRTASVRCGKMSGKSVKPSASKNRQAAAGFVTRALPSLKCLYVKKILSIYWKIYTFLFINKSYKDKILKTDNSLMLAGF
jgi:hypothetical protein